MTCDTYWYAIPAFHKTECWRICNEAGELVAKFETKEECILTVQLHNKYVEQKQENYGN